MAVVPYSSDVLCTHKSRLQLMYMDVQRGAGYKAQAKIKRRRTCCTLSIYFCAATP